MTIIKRIAALVATLSLALTALVAIEAPASAAGTSSFYKTRVNNGGAAGKARDYITVGDKIYFVGTSEDHGNAIFSTDKTNPAGATYVTSNGVSPKAGDPRNLYGVGDYLFYTDLSTNNWTYSVYAYKISTGTNTKLATSNNGEFLEDYSNRFNFVFYGGKVYFIAKDSQDPNYSDHTQVSSSDELQLWTFDITTGEIANADALSFSPQSNDRGTSAQGVNTGPNSLYVLNSKLYVPTAESGWNTRDQKVQVYNLIAKTWSAVTYNSADFAGAVPAGVFYYNNDETLIVSKLVTNSDYGYFSVDSQGAATRLGTWTSSYTGVMFVNYGDGLFVVTGSTLYELSTTTSELVEVQGFVPAGANGIYIASIVETNGGLMMMAKLSYASTPTPAPVQHIYKWTGTGAVTQVGNISPAANQEWLSNWPTTVGSSAIAQLGVFPGGVILDAYMSTTDGFEPYVVKYDGTTTLLANIAAGTEGSSPNLYCGGSSATADYVPGQTVDLNGTHDVLTEFKTVNGILQYSVFQIAGLTSLCNFAGDANTTFFTARDTTNYSYGIYKMNADKTATKLQDVSNEPNDVFMYNGNYYFRNGDFFWSVTPAGVLTQITGNAPDGVRVSSLEGKIHIGNKLYVAAQDDQDRNYGLFSYDLDHPSVAPVSLWAFGTQDWSTVPSFLRQVGNKLIFAAVPSTNADFNNQSGDNAWKGFQLYSVDSTNNNPAVKVLDINPDNTIYDTVREMNVSGNDILIIGGDDNSGSTRYLFKASLTATSTTELTKPAGLSRINCFTSFAGRLVVSDNQGASVYLDDSSAFPIRSQNSSMLCEIFHMGQGDYFVSDKTDRNLNFGDELTYYGPSVPQAVSRMGQAVTEAPETAIGGSPNVSVDTDNIGLDTLDESMNFSGAFGSINFPDGSGFSIDSKGYVKAKAKSIYLVQASGKIKFTYTVGSKTKSVSCTVKTFGSKKKVKVAFTTRKLYTSAKVCKLPAAVIKALKTSPVTVVQTLKVKRYYSTTMKTRTPVGGIIKTQNRKMTVRMGRIS